MFLSLNILNTIFYCLVYILITYINFNLTVILFIHQKNKKEFNIFINTFFI